MFKIMTTKRYNALIKRLNKAEYALVLDSEPEENYYCCGAKSCQYQSTSTAELAAHRKGKHNM